MSGALGGSGGGGIPQEDQAPIAAAGALRVVTPAQMAQADTQEAERKQRASDAANAAKTGETALQLSGLAGYVRRLFDEMKAHRNSANGWTQRMLSAARMFNGVYDADKLQAIHEAQGSDVYARVAAVKCRGASALLRDIYLGPIRPWEIKPTPVASMPEEAMNEVETLIGIEVENAQTNGVPLTPAQIESRRAYLVDQLEKGVKRKSVEQAARAQRYMDDLLVEGGFYTALAELITDVPVYPFACIKGPVVQMTTEIKWERSNEPGARATLIETQVPKMFWHRVSCFDLWWSGGASNVEAADFIHRQRSSRAQLNELIGVNGYDEAALRKVLDENPNGLAETMDVADSERAILEKRENPTANVSGMYDVLEFSGSVPGKLLRQYGWDAAKVPDETRSYAVQLWMIGRHVIKVILSPSPRKRPLFYITSFDKVPGTLVGNAIPDIIGDIQDVCNAVLRALVNNLAIASGPQAIVNIERMARSSDATSMYPWKIWETVDEPGQTNQTPPVTFFQPNSNAAELLGIYEKMTQAADEISAIPRYVTGSDRMSGAGRTASGLAMLMNNASKILQTVAGNIDRDIFEPLIQALYDIVMLTDSSGILRGDENIEVKGVGVAVQRETERQRTQEMLNTTANPMDAEIMGMRGRANLLRAVANGLGMDGQAIVPPDEEIAALEKQKQLAAQAQISAAGGGIPGVAPSIQPGADPNAVQAQGAQRGGEETGVSEPQGPRVNLQEQAPA